MKCTRLLVALAALALVNAAVATAEPKAYKLDPSHTQVGFSVRHFFTKVPGQFNTFTGTVQLDEKNLAASSVEATIEAKSIDTNQDRRDNHLRSADFFEVEKFPTLTFKSTKVTPSENNKLKIAGDLTIKGVTKPVVLDAEFLGAGPTIVEGKPNGTRAGFSASTVINRKDFGIVWNRTLDQGGTMLGDDVAITIAVEAIQEGSMPPPPPKPADKPAADAAPKK